MVKTERDMKEQSYCIYMILVLVFVTEWESQSGMASEVNSHQHDKYHYKILERYLVNTEIPTPFDGK